MRNDVTVAVNRAARIIQACQIRICRHVPHARRIQRQRGGTRRIRRIDRPSQRRAAFQRYAHRTKVIGDDISGQCLPVRGKNRRASIRAARSPIARAGI